MSLLKVILTSLTVFVALAFLFFCYVVSSEIKKSDDSFVMLFPAIVHRALLNNSEYSSAPRKSDDPQYLTRVRVVTERIASGESWSCDMDLDLSFLDISQVPGVIYAKHESFTGQYGVFVSGAPPEISHFLDPSAAGDLLAPFPRGEKSNNFNQPSQNSYISGDLRPWLPRLIEAHREGELVWDSQNCRGYGFIVLQYKGR